MRPPVVKATTDPVQAPAVHGCPKTERSRGATSVSFSGCRGDRSRQIWIRDQPSPVGDGVSAIRWHVSLGPPAVPFAERIRCRAGSRTIPVLSRARGRDRRASSLGRSPVPGRVIRLGSSVLCGSFCVLDRPVWETFACRTQLRDWTFPRRTGAAFRVGFRPPARPIVDWPEGLASCS